MIYNLIINSSNNVGVYNSVFKYDFIGGNFQINPNSEMCIASLQIPYAWFNLNTVVYNNTSLSYKFYYGSGSSNTYNISFLDGFYTLNDINNYIQQYMISQNQYFVNTNTGLNLYYIQIVTNTTYYANQWVLSPGPTAIPAGYSVPTNVIGGITYTGFNCNPSTKPGGGTQNFFCNSSFTYTPQIIIASYTGTKSIGSIIGFLAGTYPSTLQTSSYNILSNTLPNATNVNSLVIRADLVSNAVSMPTDVLDCVNINVPFGSSILYTPSYEKWVSIQSGSFTNFSLYIQDQNFNQIQTNDYNITISILLKQGPTPFIKTLAKIKFHKEEDTQEEL